LLDLVEAELDVKPGMKVLDLGCGTGNVLERVLRTGGTSTEGVDLSGSMLGAAARKLGSPIQTGRLSLKQDDLINYLKLQPSAGYDRIVSVNVVYSIPDLDVFCEEVVRVLKPTGKIVITTSVRTGSWPIIKEHFRNAPLKNLLRLKLIGVFFIDALINLLGSGGHFDFHDEAALRTAFGAVGGKWGKTVVCYGGEKDGVNILFDITR
jgi:ubiquinone/menaquinone biosynthesis C-methylase UbiE